MSNHTRNGDDVTDEPTPGYDVGAFREGVGTLARALEETFSGTPVRFSPTVNVGLGELTTTTTLGQTISVTMASLVAAGFSSPSSAMSLTPQAPPTGPILTELIEGGPVESTVISTTEEGLPDPSGILSEGPSVSALVSSGALESLGISTPSDILRIGVRRITMEHGVVQISPYVQYLLRLIAHHYSTLGNAGFSESALNLLLFVKRTTVGVSTSRAAFSPPPAVQDMYLILDAHGWNNISASLADLIFDQSTLSSQNYSVTDSLSEVNSQLEFLKSAYPDGYAFYNILCHVFQLSEAAIEPVPPELEWKEELQHYIDTIATGSESADILHVSLPVRSTTSSRGQYQPFVVPATQQLTAPPVSQGSQVHPRQPELPADPQPVRQAGFQVPPRVPEVAFEPASRARSQAQRDAALSSQADPGRYQVIRDTSTFTTTLTQDQNILAKIDALQTEIMEIKRTQVVISNTLTNLVQSQSEVCQALAVLTTQISNVNLNERANYSQTVLPADTVQAGTLIRNAVPAVPVVQTIAAGLISRIENYAPTDEILLDDVKSALINSGQSNAAQNITAAVFSNRNARSRLINRLRNTTGLPTPSQ